jgi:uncharacterized repeat protein (TIGR02543 family)
LAIIVTIIMLLSSVVPIMAMADSSIGGGADSSIISPLSVQSDQITSLSVSAPSTYQTYGTSEPFNVVLQFQASSLYSSGGTIELPLDYTPNGTTHPDFDTPNPLEPFFTVDTLPGLSEYPFIESIDTTDPTKLIFHLADASSYPDIANGVKSFPVIFSFNQDYKLKVPVDTALWDIDASAYVDAVKAIDSNLITTKCTTADKCLVMFNRNDPNTEVFNSGVITAEVKTYSHYDQIQFDPDFSIVQYIDIPVDYTVGGAITTYFNGGSEDIDGYTRYYHYGLTEDGFSAGENVHGKVQNLNFTVTPPTLASGTEFDFHTGITYKEVNAAPVTKTSTTTYKKSNRPYWDLHTNDYHSTGSAVVAVCGINNGDTSQTNMNLSHTIYSSSLTAKNAGDGPITGVSIELYQASSSSAKLNFNTVTFNAVRDTSDPLDLPTWSKYRVEYVFKGEGLPSTGQVILGQAINASGTTSLTLPIPASGQWIDVIRVIPMGDGTQEGVWLGRNGFRIVYSHKAWTGQVWPDGTTVGPSTKVQIGARLNYHDNPANYAEGADPVPMTFNYSNADLYYSSAPFAQGQLYRSSTDAVPPNSTVSYDLRGYNDTYKTVSTWDKPKLVVRIPKFMELIVPTGGFVLTDYASSQTYNVSYELVSSDATYNYYSFTANTYDAPESGAGAVSPAFTIPLQFHIAQMAPAGTTALASVVVSSANPETFNKSIQNSIVDYNANAGINTPVPSGSTKENYGFATGENYSVSVLSNTSINVMPLGNLSASSTVQTSATGGLYVGTQVVPAEHSETAQIKLTISNSGNTSFRNIRLYDILPYQSDVLGSTGSVNFAGVSVAGTSPTICYTAADPATLPDYGNRGNDVLTDNLQVSTFQNSSPWVAASQGSATSAIFLNFGSGTVLAPGESIDIILNFIVPSSGDQTALNQFRYSAEEIGTSNPPLNLNSSPQGFSTATKAVIYHEALPSTYNLNDISGIPASESSSYISGTETISVSSDEPTLTGYTFAGWAISEELATSGTVAYATGAPVSFTVAGTVNLYTVWTNNTITIAYDTNVDISHIYQPDAFDAVAGSKTAVYGGLVGSTLSSSAAVTPGPDPSRTGYDFKGWFDSEAKANDWSNNTAWYFQTDTVTNPTSGTKTLYAAWEIKKFTIDFVAGTGAASSVNGSWTNVHYGTSWQDAVIAAGAAPTEAALNAHYINPVWSAALPNDTDQITAAATYTLNYSLDSHTVTYEDILHDSGNVPSPDTKTHGQTVTVSGQGTMLRPGYTFLGWDENASVITPTYTAGSTIEDIDDDYTLHAIWTQTNYKLIYNKNTTNVTIGSVPTDATNYHITDNPTLVGNTGLLSRTGYTFGGWAANASSTTSITSVTFGSVPFALGDITVYAIWSKVPYTVSYAAGGSDVTGLPSSATITYGDSYTVSSVAPSRSGYTFNGWVATSGITGNYSSGNSFTMPASDVVLTASWTVVPTEPPIVTPATYTVSYDGGGDNVTGIPSGATLKEGDSYTVSGDIPVRDGYTFEGWVATSGISGNYSGGESFTMPASDVVLTASWEAVPTVPPVVGPPIDPPVVNPVSVTHPTVVTQEEEPIEEAIAEPNEPEVSEPTTSTEKANVDVKTQSQRKTEAKFAAQTGNPIVDLFRGNVPLGNVKFEGAWSLLSMLMSLVAVVVAVLLVLGAIVRRRDEDEIAGQARNDAGYNNDAAGDYRRRGKILRVLTIVLGVLTPVVWFVLDTLNQKVVWINKFTVYVGIVFVATVVLLVVYKVWKGDEKREAQEV